MTGASGAIAARKERWRWRIRNSDSAERGISILGTTYAPPAVRTARLEALQRDIEGRRSLLTSETQERRVLRVFRRPAQPRSAAESLQDMEVLVERYDELVKELGARIGDCRAFLEQLSGGVGRFFADKIREIRAMEAERQSLLRRAATADPASSAAVTARMESEANRIHGLSRNLAAACLLMLKKIGLAWRALVALSGDEELQRKVLERLSGSVKLFRDADKLTQSVDKLSSEIEKATRLALQFERVLEQGLGPFQALIEQTVAVDLSVAETLAEIERLNGELERSSPLASAMEAEGGHDLLAFVTRARVKQDMLEEITERLRNPDLEGEAFMLDLATGAGASAAAGPPDIETTLVNIEGILSAAAAGVFSAKPEAPQPAATPLEAGPQAAPPHPATPAPAAPARPAAAPPPLRARLEVSWERALGHAARIAPLALGAGVIVADDTGAVACLDPETGSPRWEAAVGERILSAAASTDGSMVVLGTSGGAVAALDTSSGQLVWRHTARGRVEAEPAVQGGFAWIGTMDGVVACLDARNGDVLWSVRAGLGICGRIALVGEAAVLVASTDGVLRCLNARSGKELGSIPTGTRVTGGPATHQQTACVGTQGGEVLVLACDPAGDLREVGRFATGSMNVCSPAFHPTLGVAILGASNGLAHTVRAVDGRQAGSWKIGEAVVAVALAAAEAPQPVAFVADKGGTLTAIVLTDTALMDDPSEPLCSLRISGRALAGVAAWESSGGSTAFTASRDGKIAAVRLYR